MPASLSVYRYTVPPEWDGRTVKDFARQHLGLSSRAFVKQKYLPGAW